MLSRSGLIAAVILHLAAMSGLARVQWSQELRDRFVPSDPALADLALEHDWFGSGETLAILVEPAGAIDPERLSSELRHWSAELEEIAGVESVTTLLDLPTVVWETPQIWHAVDLGSLAQPFSAALAHPLARKSLVRGDGRGVVVLLTLESAGGTRPGAVAAIVEQIEDWIAVRHEPYRFVLTGSAAFQRAATATAFRDAAHLCLPLLLMIGTILYFSFRSFAAALLVLGLGAADVAVTFGSAGLLGWRLSQFSLSVIPVIVTVSLLDSVHLVHSYCCNRDASSSPAMAAGGAISEVVSPCFWTSTTTLAGFLALLASSVPQVRQFGLLAAGATAWAFVSAFAVLPALLVGIDPHAERRLSAAVLALARLRRPSLIVAMAIVATAAALPGLGRLSVHSEFPRLFVDGHPLTEQFERIESAWGGIATISYVLTLRKGRDYADAEVLERLDDFLRLLRTRASVTSVSSPLDVLEVARANHRARFGRGLSSKQAAVVVQTLTEASSTSPLGDTLKGWVAPEHQAFRIVARVRMMRPEEFPALARDLYGFQASLEDLFEVRLSGWPLLYKNLETTLAHELLMSFALALAAVALLLLIALRSVRWWLLSLIPNLVPVCSVLGGLGVSGVGFNSGLLLAPAIALGLIVDDTIHFVFAVRRELQDRTSSIDTALQRALARAGVPISITSALLLAGFGVLTLSVFRGSRLLGAVMVAVCAAAWIADLVVLPALLRMTRTTTPESVR